MLAALLSAILPALADSVVKGLFSLLAGEMQKRNLVAEGVALQVSKDNQVAATTEARVAQAEASAPQTPTEVEKRIADGSF